MRSCLATAAAGAVVAASCGGGPARRPASARAPAFECRTRLASYVAAHHLAGDELGVQIDCAEEGPRIKRWRMDRAGTRQEDARSLTPGEFDAVWREIDGTGWANLRDCAPGPSGPSGPSGAGTAAAPTRAGSDPIYMFDIKDDQQQASFQCQSQVMPYPYNDIVDPLDLAAQRGRGQLVDPEADAGPRAPKAARP